MDYQESGQVRLWSRRSPVRIRSSTLHIEPILETVAAYGRDDPFDPVAAIAAQALLMHDLIAELGSPQLALAS